MLEGNKRRDIFVRSFFFLYFLKDGLFFVNMEVILTHLTK